MLLNASASLPISSWVSTSTGSYWPSPMRRAPRMSRSMGRSARWTSSSISPASTMAEELSHIRRWLACI